MDSNKVNKPTLMVPICGVIEERKPIVLQLEDYHYNLLIVEEDCVYPPINPMYTKLEMNIKKIEKQIKETIKIQFQRFIKKNKEVIVIQ